MGYEVFDNKAVRLGPPQLTIGGGKIYFNASAGDILKSAGARFAYILWDAAAFKLAIRPVTKQDRRAFRVTFMKGKRGGSLSASAFLTYISWRSQKSIAIKAAWNEAEKLLEARLPKECLGESARRGSRDGRQGT